MLPRFAPSLALVVFLVGCGSTLDDTDGGADAPAEDASTFEAGRDAGPGLDAGERDAGERDAGSPCGANPCGACPVGCEARDVCTSDDRWQCVCACETDPPPTAPPSFEAFRAEWAPASCARRFRCCEPGEIGPFYSTEAECIGFVIAAPDLEISPFGNMRDSIAAGGASYDLARARACLDSLAAVTCTRAQTDGF